MNSQKAECGNLDMKCHKRTKNFTKSLLKLRSKNLKSRSFQTWIQYSRKIKHNHKLNTISIRHYNQRTVRSYFKGWKYFVFQQTHEQKIETLVKNVISRYETELKDTRSQLCEAKKEIARCHFQRQNLEEKMRLTLLQGMTNMNTRALELFNESAPMNNNGGS